MKLDRKQIAELLNVKIDGLKTIERRKQLETRLKDIGYKLIEKTKSGRNNYYTVKKIGKNQNQKILYNSICKNVFRTNRPTQFGLFFNIRTEFNDKAFTNKELADLSHITVKSITKWNNCLLDKGIIVRDGFFYFYVSNFDHKISQCSKEEYKNYWKNKINSKNKEYLEDCYLNGKMTLSQVIDKAQDTGAAKLYIEGRYYYRIKKYKTNTDNQLYIDIKDLLELFNINYKVSRVPVI